MKFHINFCVLLSTWNSFVIQLAEVIGYVILEFAYYNVKISQKNLLLEFSTMLSLWDCCLKCDNAIHIILKRNWGF